jgi:hypothetical protein
MSKGWYSTHDLVVYGRLKSRHMVAYLCRTGILVPSLSPSRDKGKRLQFSFADLLLARAVSTLLAKGVSVEKLRTVLKTLRTKLGRDAARALTDKHVVIVGNRVYLHDSPEALLDLTGAGQLAFYFVLDVRVAPSWVIPDGRVRRTMTNRGR